MAGNLRLGTTAKNAAADAVAALCNSGFLDVYDGTQPAADGAVTTQTKGIRYLFGATAFGSAASGVATANAIAAATVIASITPTWCRALKSDGTTIVFDGNVSVGGAGGANLNYAAASLVVGATSTPTALTYTQPAQGT